jgi:hypothetical protein
MDAETQRERVRTRGRSVRDQIEAGLPVLQAQMIRHGALRIDATQPTSRIADQLLESVAATAAVRAAPPRNRVWPFAE